MTEAMPIDVSGKIISNAKPAAPSPAGPPGAAKPPEKPSAKGATGDAPPAPGSKTFLGWVAGGFSRKQLTVAVAAVCSLGRGDRGRVADLAGGRTTDRGDTSRSSPTRQPRRRRRSRRREQAPP